MKKFIVIFCLFSIIANAESEKSRFRNIIILLDQEGICENIGRPNAWSIMHRFQSAVQEKEAPILINAALLRTFIERRQSIEQMAKIPETSEQKALTLYDKITERLNYWYSHCIGKNIDPIQAKQIMIDQVNEEFYTKKDTFVVSNGINGTLRAYFTDFNKKDWQIYTNEKGMYLLVPENYIKRLQQKEADVVAIKTQNLTEKEALLGLKVDHLKTVDDIENPVLLYLKNKFNTLRLPHHLKDFFVVKDEMSEKNLPFAWNVVISGHGWFSYQEMIKSTKDKEADIIISDLTPSEITHIFEFFKNNLKTHYVHFSTCNGGGVHWDPVFDKNNIYDYAIGTDSLADGTSYCLYNFLRFPSNNNELLFPDDITTDSAGKWKLKLDHVYHWTNFFKEISEYTFDQPGLSGLDKILNNISASYLCNTCQIRLPNSIKFIPVLKNNIRLISDESLEMMPHKAQINTNDNVLLIQSLIVNKPIVCTNNNAPRIASIVPGASTHYFERLEFKSSKKLLNCFWPIEGNLFDKFFIIQEFEFPSDEIPFFKEQLGILEQQIILKNVLIHTSRSDVARIFFQTSNDVIGMLILTKNEDRDPLPSIKGIQILSPDASKLYLEHYAQLKDKVINKIS